MLKIHVMHRRFYKLFNYNNYLQLNSKNTTTKICLIEDTIIIKIINTHIDYNIDYNTLKILKI